MITITRNSGAVVSPKWEILRARFGIVSFNGRFGPWILALKTVPPHRNIQDMRGIQIEANNNSFWTAPLAYFDPSIPDQGAVGGTLDQRNVIVEPAFIQWLDGVPGMFQSERWSCTGLSYSDPFGYLTRQFFTARLQQEQESTSLVF